MELCIASSVTTANSAKTCLTVQVIYQGFNFVGCFAVGGRASGMGLRWMGRPIYGMGLRGTWAGQWNGFAVGGRASEGLYGGQKQFGLKETNCIIFEN